MKEELNDGCRFAFLTRMSVIIDHSDTEKVAKLT